jgi:putative transposase
VHTDASTFYMTDKRTDACSRGQRRPLDVAQGQKHPDNARAKGFFGTLKSDLFSSMDWADSTFEEFKSCLDSYIEWYCLTKLKRALWVEDAQGAQERP